jgi:para-aminobenzoate synthetase/4-amino-4-deoxychorismate lyase
MAEPFVLLDDARREGASDARLYRAPQELVVARRGEEVAPALERIARLASEGYDMAGHIAYEAGLALEPHLIPLLPARCGASGPLVWFGAFNGYETIAASDVPARLSAMAGGQSGSLGPMEPQLSPGGYARAFERLSQAIRAGDIYQANLTMPLAGSWRGDPVALYAAIRPGAAAGYGGIVHDGSHWLLSFSPELFFALKAGSATVKPMKGTRPRGRDAAEDAQFAAELSVSTKERAENLMIVDLMRNDLSRIARPGSVRVDNAFAIETYPTVHQMVSTVRADLREGLGALDMIRALFPCGSITGAPKIRAMELIAEVEANARGPYCGAIGRIDSSGPHGTGDAAFNVAIRTLRLTESQPGQGTAVLGVGSAIVADSSSMAEWRECLIKGEFVRQSAASFDLIEAMLFTPDAGIPLLELHLERMKASAAELGFPFDRHQLRNRIQALCFDLDEAAKVRVLLSRSGATALEAAPLGVGQLSEPVVCGALRLPIDSGDWRLRHKTSDRSFYDAARDAAVAAGAQEAILVRDDGMVTEASRSNIFLARGDMLLTPPLSLGLLPGVLRRSLIEQGRAIEALVHLDDLAGGFWLGNSVRGLMKAKLL